MGKDVKAGQLCGVSSLSYSSSHSFWNFLGLRQLIQWIFHESKSKNKTGTKKEKGDNEIIGTVAFIRLRNADEIRCLFQLKHHKLGRICTQDFIAATKIFYHSHKNILSISVFKYICPDNHSLNTFVLMASVNIKQGLCECHNAGKFLSLSSIDFQEVEN